MKRFNYRHIICITIILGFLACSVFFFSGALGRLIESCRDIGLSFGFYFCELFEIPHNIMPTINDLPKVPFFDFFKPVVPPEQSTPTVPLPDTADGFVVKWQEFWQLFINGENIKAYFSSIYNFLLTFCKVLVILLPIILVIVLMFRRYLRKQNNNYNNDTKPLRVFKVVAKYTYRPVKQWLIGFYEFLQEHKQYLIISALIWAYNFNFITIFLEFIAYYFYFVVSFDIASLYRQVYKLFIDLSVVFKTIPLFGWIVIGIVALWLFSVKQAYATLNHRERRNMGFLNERGICNEVYGYIGSGKTALLTDISLTYDVQMLNDAFEIILETDMKFVNFPWINLELELKRACCFHEVYDVWSCRRWVRKKFERWIKSPCSEKIFDYDYNTYGLTYDNKLCSVSVWQAIKDYASAYFVYTVQSSYIISNYSIRTDRLMADIGNFPLWNTDFFKRDSRLIESFSRHSHILDFDMLRLGKKMFENNPNRNAFGFGVYVISEIDKERKNSPELQETKRNAVECNQKNDLTNTCVKMSRHACVIANRVFVRIIGDLQRMGSLNSDLGELGDTIGICGDGEMFPVLPFYSPFWLVDMLGTLILSKFYNFYTQYRYNRADNTLFLYLCKMVAFKFFAWHDRINNIFGSQVIELAVENGFKDGNVKQCKWFRQSKKVFSNRYATDCMSAIFESRGEINTVGIDDLAEYADIMASQEELDRQHSHFQREINKILETSN